MDKGEVPSERELLLEARKREENREKEAISIQEAEQLKPKINEFLFVNLKDETTLKEMEILALEIFRLIRNHNEKII